MHRADPGGGTALDQPRLNFDQCHVALLSDQRTDEATMRFDLARMPVAATRPGHCLTMLQGKLSPADCARHADTEARCRRVTAQAARNRRNNPVSKIL
jgi:hypothetical protein